MDLDEALERFHRTGLEYFGGLANHGPMAAEALCRLGHPALIEGLIDAYAPRLPSLETGTTIPASQRTAALGDPARLRDWVSTFDRETTERSWREVLASWVDVLLPGLFAGAAHGLLRVAHAVRALEEAETPPRRRELGMGLAYWAGRYQELPGSPSSSPLPGRGVAATFEAVQIVPPDRRRPGFFFDAVRVLDEDADFAGVVEAFDPGEADVSQVLHEIAVAAARLYLAHPAQRIAYVHCLTAPSCLRLLARHLASETARRACGYAIQAALALHAVSATPDPVAGPDTETERLAGDPAEIRYRAACSLEEHAIKLSEACLRENEIHPDPVFLLAAADAAIHLESKGGRGASA